MNLPPQKKIEDCFIIGQLRVPRHSYICICLCVGINAFSWIYKLYNSSLTFYLINIYLDNDYQHSCCLKSQVLNTISPVRQRFLVYWLMMKFPWLQNLTCFSCPNPLSQSSLIKSVKEQSLVRISTGTTCWYSANISTQVWEFLQQVLCVLLLWRPILALVRGVFLSPEYGWICPLVMFLQVTGRSSSGFTFHLHFSP